MWLDLAFLCFRCQPVNSFWSQLVTEDHPVLLFKTCTIHDLASRTGLIGTNAHPNVDVVMWLDVEDSCGFVINVEDRDLAQDNPCLHILYQTTHTAST